MSLSSVFPARSPSLYHPLLPPPLANALAPGLSQMTLTRETMNCLHLSGPLFGAKSLLIGVFLVVLLAHLRRLLLSRRLIVLLVRSVFRTSPSSLTNYLFGRQLARFILLRCSRCHSMTPRLILSLLEANSIRRVFCISQISLISPSRFIY